MYSLVALGFVLIYKASGVFNFAQGAMVLFAALTSSACIERGLPFWRPPSLLAARDDGRARPADRALVLRPLVNQAQIMLFMATIGLAFFLEGLGAGDLGQRRPHARSRHPDEPMMLLENLPPAC